ncbi:MAG: hypothetical protein ACXAD7_27340 [Candidatus Kariarchaeaceae archaeon]
MTTEIKKQHSALIDELSSYIWGVLILVSLASFMLLIHIGLSIFFHN